MIEVNQTMLLVSEDLSHNKRNCLEVQLQTLDKSIFMLVTEKQKLSRDYSLLKKDS